MRDKIPIPPRGSRQQPVVGASSLPARISAPVGVPVVITSEGTPLHKIIALSPVVLILIAPRRSPHALTLISFALAHGYAVSTSDTVTVMRRDDIDPNDHHPEGSEE